MAIDVHAGVPTMHSPAARSVFDTLCDVVPVVDEAGEAEVQAQAAEYAAALAEFEETRAAQAAAEIPEEFIPDPDASEDVDDIEGVFEAFNAQREVGEDDYKVSMMQHGDREWLPAEEMEELKRRIAAAGEDEPTDQGPADFFGELERRRRETLAGQGAGGEAADEASGHGPPW